MAAVESEDFESNNLYIMLFAIVIAFLMIFAVILSVFAIAGASSLNSDVASATTEDTGPDPDILKLQKLAGNDAGWTDAKTTSIAVLALNKAGIGLEEIWQNQNGNEVSLGNKFYPNSIQWLDEYLVEFEYELDVESFSLSLLAIEATGSGTSGQASAITALKDAQDPATGNWNDDIYETALATYVLSKIEGPQDASVMAGIGYLQGQEQDMYFDTVLDSSTAILALYGSNYDVTGELKTLVSHQDQAGSFGTIEDTTWAALAITVDETGNTYSYGKEAQAWLAEQSDDGTNVLELGYIVLGTGIDYMAYEESVAYPPEDDTVDNGSFGANESIPADGLVLDGENAGLHPFGQLSERDKDGDGLGNEVVDQPPDDGHEGFFENDLLWTIIAIVIVLVIMSLATWGLIARVEEGRALEGVRRDIFEYIKHNPGEHFAGIMHEFDMSPSSTTYHLKVLEDTEQVVAHRDNKYKRYYAAGNTLQLETQTKNYKELMSALKNVTARKIVWYILDHQGSNQKDVATALGIHPSTVNWHANRLYQAGILEKLKSGKEITYSIPNEDSVRSAMTIIEDRT
jgi:predicted transcriptional regulator